MSGWPLGTTGRLSTSCIFCLPVIVRKEQTLGKDPLGCEDAAFDGLLHVEGFFRGRLNMEVLDKVRESGTHTQAEHDEIRNKHHYKVGELICRIWNSILTLQVQGLCSSTV